MPANIWTATEFICVNLTGKCRHHESSHKIKRKKLEQVKPQNA